MRVLVIEDERRLADNLAQSLRESAGYAVDVARDGEEGLYFAQSGEYDLIVLDLMLPKLDGQGLLTQYRRRGKNSVHRFLPSNTTLEHDPENHVVPGRKPKKNQRE